MHSPEYPLKGPDYMMLTPNGRFTPDKKICLTNSAYHPESWSAMWNIRNMLDGFLSVMVADQDGGISHIRRTTDSPKIRKKYADESVAYNLKNYPTIFKKFGKFINEDGTVRQTPKVEVKKEKVKKIEKPPEKKIIIDSDSDEPDDDYEDSDAEAEEEIEKTPFDSKKKYSKLELEVMCRERSISLYYKSKNGKLKKCLKAELFDRLVAEKIGKLEPHLLTKN
jgi:hypothetical protein